MMCMCVCARADQGHIRKGECLFFMEDFDSAKESYESALRVDPQNKECVEAISELTKLLAGQTSD